MKNIIMSAKTLEEALKNALRELKVTEDKVEYEVLEEGNKGFLGIGAKPAKISVTVKRDYVDEARTFLKNVLDTMDIKAEVIIKEEKDIINITLTGDKMGVIIGYRGETLDSLQYLTSLVVNKQHDIPYKRIVLDTENYRSKREETLRRLADKTAYKVKNSGRPFKLEPMNPYERRIIHSALQGDASIHTYSEGEEPYRRIVVEKKR